MSDILVLGWKCCTISCQSAMAAKLIELLNWKFGIWTTRHIDAQAALMTDKCTFRVAYFRILGHLKLMKVMFPGTCSTFSCWKWKHLKLTTRVDTLCLQPKVFPQSRVLWFEQQGTCFFLQPHRCVMRCSPLFLPCSQATGFPSCLATMVRSPFLGISASFLHCFWPALRLGSFFLWHSSRSGLEMVLMIVSLELVAWVLWIIGSYWLIWCTI